MLKQEIWNNIRVQPHETTPTGVFCNICCFDRNSNSCNAAQCTPNMREDGKDVYFTETSVDACCGEYATCENVCVPKELHLKGKDSEFIEVGEDESDKYNEHTARQWEAFAAQQVSSVNYYRGLLDEIGDMLGISAYTSDDGSIQNSPLREKIPELVAKKVYENVCFKAKVSMLEFDAQVNQQHLN